MGDSIGESEASSSSKKKIDESDSSIDDSDSSIDESFQDWLLCVHNNLRTNDWSLLLSFIDPTFEDPNWNIQHALSSELVSLFVWLLFSEVSHPLKVGVVRGLRLIISASSKDTYMPSIDHVGFKTSASSEDTNVPIDQTIVDNLLVEALRLENTEVQRQVCYAIQLSVSCYEDRGITIGDGVQNQAIQLVCNNDTQQSLIPFALLTVATICSVSKGMDEKIMETDINNKWLRNILNTRDEIIMEHAWYTVATVIAQKSNIEIWKYSMEYFMPCIFRWLETFESRNTSLMIAASSVIHSATKDASPDQIQELVNNGCLKALFILAFFLVYTTNCNSCLHGIENILRAGVYETENEYGEPIQANKYVELVNNYDVGWFILRNADSFYDIYGLGVATSILDEFCPESQYWSKYR